MSCSLAVMIGSILWGEECKRRHRRMQTHDNQTEQDSNPRRARQGKRADKKQTWTTGDTETGQQLLGAVHLVLLHNGCGSGDIKSLHVSASAAHFVNFAREVLDAHVFMNRMQNKRKRARIERMQRSYAHSLGAAPPNASNTRAGYYPDMLPTLSDGREALAEKQEQPEWLPVTYDCGRIGQSTTTARPVASAHLLDDNRCTSASGARKMVPGRVSGQVLNASMPHVPQMTPAW